MKKPTQQLHLINDCQQIEILYLKRLQSESNGFLETNSRFEIERERTGCSRDSCFEGNEYCTCVPFMYKWRKENEKENCSIYANRMKYMNEEVCVVRLQWGGQPF